MRFQIPIRVASINTSIEGNVDSYEHCLIECMQLRQCELPGNLCLELALHTEGIAYEDSLDMGDHNVFSHTGSDG